MSVTHTSVVFEFPTRTGSNYGPLTTTFTPAPSCINASNAIAFGYLDGYYASSLGFDASGYPTCSIQPYGDACFPSADRWNSENSDIFKTKTAVLNYFSPGIYCPESWTEAAHITRHEGTVSGTPNVTGSGAIAHNTDYQNILALSNTLVMCCPDQYTGDRLGACYSPLPSTPLPTEPSSVSYCVYPTPSEDLTTVSATTVLATASSPLWLVTRVVSVTEVQKIEPTTTTVRVSQVSAFTYVPAVVLVHAKSDLPSAGVGLAHARASVSTLLLSMWLLAALF